MEVHHHPHIGKKKTKEYILEGLMIFFVVTMGFFAEQLREFIVERRQEREIIHHLVKDLQQDQKSVKRITDWLKDDVFPAGDSVKFLLIHPNTFENDNSLYVNCRHLVRYSSINVFINNQTYTQLKNTNGINLIQDKAIADSINSYYNYIDRIHDLELYLFQEKQELRQLMPILLNGDMYDMVVNNKDQVIRPYTALKARPITESQKNDFLLKISDINGISRNILNRLLFLEEESHRLSEYISKAYHLEKE